MNITELYPLTQAARLIGMSEDTLRYNADKGYVRCFKDRVGRRFFDKNDLLQFKERKMGGRKCNK
ncbi:MAG: helix-turn-helix domain-containing protein [Armatimonadota bacterium]|nr:helix-turn-helix domain-containing protein [Armatimonadota bacterium]